MDKPESTSLPTFGFYRRNCHSSHHNYLAYLSSTTEIRVLKFSADKKANIEKETVLKIPQEPVKAIRIYSSTNNTFDLAVCFITRFIIFKDENKQFEFNLTLGGNIVDFREGFVGVEIANNKKNWKFVFATRAGQVIIFDPETKSKVIKTPKKPTADEIQSFGVLENNIYLTTPEGCIIGVRIMAQNEHYEQFSRNETHKSGYPIFCILTNEEREQIYMGNSHGEIYILGKDLNKNAILSAHYSMVVRMMRNGDRLYTIGEDGIMHVFEILGDRKLRAVESRSFMKLPGLLFGMDCGSFMTFYESPKIIQI